MHLAVDGGHSLIISLLLANGASVLARTTTGKRPRDLAVDLGHADLVTQLDAQMVRRVTEL